MPETQIRFDFPHTMLFTPRPEQAAAIKHAKQSLLSRRAKQLYVSPTGTGKSVIELALQDALPHLWIVSPVLEVIDGLLRKRGVDTDSLSESQFLAAADAHHIATPIRLRNRLLAGESLRIDYVAYDEVHHHNAETWQQLDMLTGTPSVGYTATPFRGTPRGTKELLDTWGDPVWIITYAESVARGRLSHPTCQVVPLVDDDVINVSAGEFAVRSVEYHTRDRLQAVVDMSRQWHAAAWDRPTMYALPSRTLALEFAEKMNAAGLPAVAVTQETAWQARRDTFAATVACQVALIQVRVVGEGVDLPLRRLVDLAPCISPTLWQQRFGRITRPVPAGDAPPEYVCCNRNLLRHAYLLEGMVPPRTIADAQSAFGGPGKRDMARVVGLEVLGRLKAIELPFAGGIKGAAYCMSAIENGKAREYAVILHPAKPSAIWATRVNVPRDDGTRSYGRWEACSPPDDLSGFASAPPSPLSDKQAAWWKRSAGRYGLDASAKVTRKSFAALPVLSDLKVRVA
jgi:superfamily II DNA or RNA helicase